MRPIQSLFIVLLLSVSAACADEGDKMRALIIDGQNNHGVWPKTTELMKGYLEETGLFTVDIARTAPKGTDPDFKPDFSKYKLVVSNYNGAPWPDETKEAFVKYVKNGGGFVVVHAANNAFGDWQEYNEIIGLGGWGGRNEKSGPYVVYRDGKIIKDLAKGRGGSHGRQHDFLVAIREKDHPITKGLPAEWLHVKDELYDRLRGPAENMTVLATSYSDPDTGGRGEHEPMMMVLNYGKGRVYHTPMGHGDYSMKCIGYIVTFKRGCEWAATGKVTQTDVPDNFPTKDKTSSRE